MEADLPSRYDGRDEQIASHHSRCARSSFGAWFGVKDRQLPRSRSAPHPAPLERVFRVIQQMAISGVSGEGAQAAKAIEPNLRSGFNFDDVRKWPSPGNPPLQIARAERCLHCAWEPDTPSVILRASEGARSSWTQMQRGFSSFALSRPVR